MKTALNQQRGVILLEVLISLVIFALGVLAIIGLQAVTAKAGVDARFRTEAATLADELVSRAQTWTDMTSLRTNFQSGNATGTPAILAGTEYQDWVNNKLSFAATGLPGAQATVTFPAAFTATGAGAIMTVNISWQMPGKADRSSHTTVAALPGTGG